MCVCGLLFECMMCVCARLGPYIFNQKKLIFYMRGEFLFLDCVYANNFYFNVNNRCFFFALSQTNISGSLQKVFMYTCVANVVGKKFTLRQIYQYTNQYMMVKLLSLMREYIFARSFSTGHTETI